MWYKRYGYKQPSRNGGIGCIGATLPVLVGIAIAFFATVLLHNLWFLLLIIPIAFAGFWIAERQSFGEGERIHQRRYTHHVREAYEHVMAGRKGDALESIRKIKIYGDLPADLAGYERRWQG